MKICSLRVNKVLSLLLIFCFIFTTPIHAATKQGDSVIVLVDNHELRTVRATVDGKTSTVTYYKQKNSFRISENNVTTTVNVNSAPSFTMAKSMDNLALSSYAAGVSAGTALASGGSFYLSSKAYNEAMDLFERIEARVG